MKKYLLAAILITISLLSVETGQAQKNTNQKTENKKEPYFFWGGSLWMGFGSYTYVDVNVVFGTQLTERLNLGVGGKYQYLKDKRPIDGSFETNVYGGSVFSQFAVIKDFRNLFKVRGHSGIIAHTEYEFLNTKYNYLYFNVANQNRDRYWLHNILVGGGYFQEIGDRAKSYIVLLWNLSKTEDNPYTYPQFRIGFSVAI